MVMLGALCVKAILVCILPFVNRSTLNIQNKNN